MYPMVHKLTHNLTCVALMSLQLLRPETTQKTPSRKYILMSVNTNEQLPSGGRNRSGSMITEPVVTWKSVRQLRGVRSPCPHMLPNSTYYKTDYINVTSQDAIPALYSLSFVSFFHSNTETSWVCEVRRSIWRNKSISAKQHPNHQ